VSFLVEKVSRKVVSLTLLFSPASIITPNRLLRRVFGPRRDEATGEWRKLHSEELSDLYSLPNIVRVVKSRRMRWACGGGERGAQGSGGET
jgi:hypothetical protein